MNVMFLSLPAICDCDPIEQTHYYYARLITYSRRGIEIEGAETVGFDFICRSGCSASADAFGHTNAVGRLWVKTIERVMCRTSTISRQPNRRVVLGEVNLNIAHVVAARSHGKDESGE